MITVNWVARPYAGSCNACDHGRSYKKVFEIEMGSFYASSKLVIRLCKECLSELKRKTGERYG